VAVTHYSMWFYKEQKLLNNSPHYSLTNLVHFYIFTQFYFSAKQLRNIYYVTTIHAFWYLSALIISKTSKKTITS